MSESRTSYARRIHALSVSANESAKIAREDRDARDLEIFRAYETGEWILADLAREAGLSLSYVHKVIRQQAEKDPGHDDL
jgi:AraC-like DNA-binding protein